MMTEACTEPHNKTHFLLKKEETPPTTVIMDSPTTDEKEKREFEEQEKLRKIQLGLRLFSKGEQERRQQLDKICNFYRIETQGSTSSKRGIPVLPLLNGNNKLISRSEGIMRQPSMPTIAEEPEEEEGGMLDCSNLTPRKPIRAIPVDLANRPRRAVSDPPLPFPFRLTPKTREASKLGKRFEENQIVSILSSSNPDSLHIRDTEASSPLEEALPGVPDDDKDRAKSSCSSFDSDNSDHGHSPSTRLVTSRGRPGPPGFDGSEKEVHEQSSSIRHKEESAPENKQIGGPIPVDRNHPAEHYQPRRSFLETTNHHHMPSNADFLSRTRAFSDPPQPT